jgi:hypothetical protein
VQHIGNVYTVFKQTFIESLSGNVLDVRSNSSIIGGAVPCRKQFAAAVTLAIRRHGGRRNEC